MIRINIVPHQLLLPNNTIEVESKAPLSPRAACAGISVADVGGQVRLASGGKRAGWPDKNRPAPGRYTLRVRDLVGRRGKAIVERHVVPVTVVATKAKVRPSVR